jgi:hypothetical protein
LNECPEGEAVAGGLASYLPLVLGLLLLPVIVSATEESEVSAPFSPKEMVPAGVGAAGLVLAR